MIDQKKLYIGDANGNNSCPFCVRDRADKVIGSLRTVWAVEDSHPVTPGHLLVIPRRHTPDFFSMNSKEKGEAIELINLLKEQVQRADPTVLGFNIGINCGETAGQTVPHAHIHLIPRRKGDTADPRGGIRGIIPEKMKY